MFASGGREISSYLHYVSELAGSFSKSEGSGH